MGLEKIRSVSKQGPYELQVELSDEAGQQLPVARYAFQLGGEEDKFALHLEDKTASPPMTKGSSGIPFSTADRDNDLAVEVNCAEMLSGMTPPSTPEQHVNGHKHLIFVCCIFSAGGWWFSSCGDWNLNGRYPSRPNAPNQKQPGKPEMFWTSQGRRHSVKTTLLKIAPTRRDV